jgi:glycerophosphoryl diester phosphodiesterase
MKNRLKKMNPLLYYKREMKKFRNILFTLTVCFVTGCASLPDTAVEIIAHRGVPFAAPENTRASVRLALERGADAVEIDVHQTRDGQIVVIHDSSTIRVASVNKFISHTDYDDLKNLDVGSHFSSRYAGEPIPLLSDILDILPPGKNLYIEIKTGTAILPELVRVIRESGREENIRIISFKREVLQKAKQQLPEIPCYLLLLHVPRDSYISLIEELKAFDLDGIGLISAAVTPELVEILSENGFGCITWTVNSLAAAGKLIEAGVTGITTNVAGRFKRKIRQ